MRMLHTSDWHLGRSFGQVSLAADQAAFVEWLLDVVRTEEIELVVIAGDLFDRAIPPVESVALLRHALTGIVAAGAKVVAVAGNHDSADRVAAADGLTDAAGVTVRGGYARAGETITLAFPDGPLDVVAIPYLDPLMAPEEVASRSPAERHRAVGDPDSAPAELPLEAPASARPNHQRVLSAAVARHVRGASRSVAVAHAFVAGALESDSERALTVGTSPRVATTTFDGFSYVALGHLHRPQVVGGHPTRRYSGSPLPYSFSERHPKQVVVVDLEPGGAATVTELTVPVGRPVAELTGTLHHLLQDPRHAPFEQHFVRAVLTDAGHVTDAKAHLLQRFPFVAEIVLRPPATTVAAPDTFDPSRRARLAPIEAATAFWVDVAGSAPTGTERALLAEVLDRARAAVAVAT